MPLTGVVNVTLEYRPRVPLEGGYTNMAQVRMSITQYRQSCDEMFMSLPLFITGGSPGCCGGRCWRQLQDP
jgi:hypothetical protein